MRYENKGGQSRDDCMRAAYVLSNRFKAPHKALAATFGCSKSTISAWNKESEYKERIFRLEKELADIRNSQYIDSIEAINNAEYEQHIEYLNNENNMSGVDDMYDMEAINNAQYEQHIEYLNNENI